MTQRAVAIVHDYLTQRGGAERVVLALHRAFPDAPIFTSLYEPGATYPEFAELEIHTSHLNRVELLRERHRAALPLLAPVFSAMKIDADVVICSSSGWAHGVRTTGRKVVYCYAPARWIHQPDAYLARSGALTRLAMRVARPALLQWDRRAARSADRYIAISRHSRDLIRAAYGIDSRVVFPPCTIEPEAARAAVPGLEPGFFLCVSRLLAYKHVGAVVEAFRHLPAERLVVVGSGPEEPRLRSLGLPNVRLLSAVSDAQLRWLYAHAAALIAAAFEDFGLTPVEAAAFGTPSIALRYGGYLDTVVEEGTGLFFDRPEPAAIADAVGSFDRSMFDAGVVRDHASGFSEARFRAHFADVAGFNGTVGRAP